MPGQETGAINLLPNPNPSKVSTPSKISVDKSGYFYHMVDWRGNININIYININQFKTG